MGTENLFSWRKGLNWEGMKQSKRFNRSRDGNKKPSNCICKQVSRSKSLQHDLNDRGSIQVTDETMPCLNRWKTTCKMRWFHSEFGNTDDKARKSGHVCSAPSACSTIFPFTAIPGLELFGGSMLPLFCHHGYNCSRFCIVPASAQRINVFISRDRELKETEGLGIQNYFTNDTSSAKLILTPPASSASRNTTEKEQWQRWTEKAGIGFCKWLGKGYGLGLLKEKGMW